MVTLGYDDPRVKRWCKEMGAIGGQDGADVYAQLKDLGVEFGADSAGGLVLRGFRLKPEPGK